MSGIATVDESSEPVSCLSFWSAKQRRDDSDSERERERDQRDNHLALAVSHSSSISLVSLPDKFSFLVTNEQLQSKTFVIFVSIGILLTHRGQEQTDRKMAGLKS